MKPGASVGAQADDIAGIGRYLRLEQHHMEHRGSRSGRFHYHQQYCADQHENGKLVEPAIKHMPVPIFVLRKLLDHVPAPEVIPSEDHHQRDLSGKPQALTADAENQLRPQAGRDGQHAAWGGNAKVEFALHHFELILSCPICTHGVIDKQPGKIEEPGKPGHHEDDM